MGLEDDFLKDDLDDEKTIEYIKNYLPQIHFDTSFFIRLYIQNAAFRIILVNQIEEIIERFS